MNPRSQKLAVTIHNRERRPPVAAWYAAGRGERDKERNGKRGMPGGVGTLWGWGTRKGSEMERGVAENHAWPWQRNLGRG